MIDYININILCVYLIVYQVIDAAIDWVYVSPLSALISFVIFIIPLCYLCAIAREK